MTQTPFTIGSHASTTDGPIGEVTRVIIDPVADTLTHLVVEPHGREGLARLVPIDLVETADGEIRINCTRAGFEDFDYAEETQYIPGTRGYADYGPEQVAYNPYYRLGVPGPVAEPSSQVVTYDTVPLGEVDVRRGEHVHATDGSIGHVEGLVIDPASHHVTHVLLKEGHLWGRKEVAIPISAVTGVEDGIALSLSKHEVQNLPAVDIHHPDF
jgi:sporulation protein YlmC with PRC-barrel domain